MDKTTKLHVFYIIGILVSIIIVLIVIKWGEIEGLVGYINFAATVTSLAVGLLAIFYAIYSNTTLSRNSSELTISSQRISDISEKFSASIEILENSIEKMPETLEKIDRKTDQTIKHLEQLGEKEKVIPRNENNSSDTPKFDAETQKRMSIKILSRNSINGYLTLYIIKVAYESKKQFNLDTILSKLDISNQAYSYAYLLPLSSLELFKYQEVKNGDKYDWLVSYIDPYLQKEIKERMVEFEGKESEKYDFLKGSLTNPMSKIDNYFRQ